jgi:DNA invertase Pin-like site-specific DNA recombinase
MRNCGPCWNGTVTDQAKLLGVSYIRVSTTRQGVSGLGLEAQRRAVAQFVASQKGELLAEFTEVQSGKRNDRQALNDALEFCRKNRATLLLAKLDRLSRKVHFISGLMESKVDFLSIEHPTRDRFWLHLQAAFAEEEGRRISLRTKAALNAAKSRGVELGKTGKILAKRHHAEAMEKAKDYASVVEELRRSGIKTVKATMEALNERNVPSPGGAKWHLRSTWKLLKRLRAQSGEEP